MGLNPHLLKMAQARVKQAEVADQNLNLSMTPGLPGAPGMGGPKGPAPEGPRGPFSLAGRGLDMVGGTALRHPLLTLGGLYGAKVLYDSYKPKESPQGEKQADVPPTPMSAPAATPGMPPAPTPPPTNGAPVSPSPATQFGSVQNAPVQQTNQAEPMVTTSQGAANVPPPGQGAAQKAPGLVKPSGK